MSKKDITQKHYFNDNEKFADVMNAVNFHGKQVIKPSELQDVSVSFLKADEQAVVERIADVVRKQTKDGTVYAMYIMENQETVDYRMPVRVMLEEGLAYDKQVREISKKNNAKIKERLKLKSAKKNTDTVISEEIFSETDADLPTDGEFLYKFLKSDRLAPIYTTVIYWGDKEWDGATSLRELIDLPETDEELKEEMRELLPDYKIRVFDLNKETDFSAFQTDLKTVFEFYSYKNEKTGLKEYMNTHREEVEGLDDESKFFLATMLGRGKLREELLKQDTQRQEERSMCKALEDMLADAEQEGIMKGRAEAEETIANLQAESEKTIANLKKELEEENRLLKLEIERLKNCLA